MSEDAAEPTSPEPSRLRSLAALFLRLGFCAFGGPAAHIAMMEDEVITRRGWLTKSEFLDLLGITNLLPGPNSTEMAIIIGYRRAGWPGLLVAGLCFICPAVAIVMVCAVIYQRYHTVPAVEGILYLIKPVIIAVILNALVSLGKKGVKSRTLGVIAVLGAALHFLGVNELALLFGCATLAGLLRWFAEQPRPSAKPLLGLAATGALLITVPWVITLLATGDTAFGLGPLFVVFAKIGSILYGSGYVLLAFLQADLVNRLHWLSMSQLLDAVAVGQVTPGPVFTTATFVGYLLGGGWGAVVATVGIFLPSFLLVALGEKLVGWMRQSVLAGAFLDGLVAAALGLMAAVAVQFGQAAMIDPLTAAVAVLSAVLLVKYKVNTTWLIGGAAVLGLILGH